MNTSRWGLVSSVDWRKAPEGPVRAAVARASRLAYAILDGTLIPIDRVADELTQLETGSL